jgi:hypothetical protein
MFHGSAPYRRCMLRSFQRATARRSSRKAGARRSRNAAPALRPERARVDAASRRSLLAQGRSGCMAKLRPRASTSARRPARPESGPRPISPDIPRRSPRSGRRSRRAFGRTSSPRSLDRSRRCSAVITLDDFGTGYSSLARLRAFPTVMTAEPSMRHLRERSTTRSRTTRDPCPNASARSSRCASARIACSGRSAEIAGISRCTSRA